MGSVGEAIRGTALFTDSTADLDPAVARHHGISIVPLHVHLPGQDLVDSLDSAQLALVYRSLTARGSLPSTSRPSPAAFLRAYEEAVRRGARSIVSIHVSGALSGTYDSACLAARELSVPVTVIDSATISVALGLQVVAAAQSLAAGADPEAAVEAALRVRQHTTMVFYVHSLEHLRRGGRLGAAASLLGGALAIKPLLALEDGHIVAVEKLRTQARALTKLVDIAAHTVQVEGEDAMAHVLHVGNEHRAAVVCEALRSRGVSVGPVRELGAVSSVHAGPGAIGVVIGPAVAV